MKVERWALMLSISEQLLAESVHEDMLIRMARARFERDQPDFEILEVEPLQVTRAQPPFDWTTYEDEDGVERTYKTPPYVRVVLKVAKR